LVNHNEKLGFQNLGKLIEFCFTGNGDKRSIDPSCSIQQIMKSAYDLWQSYWLTFVSLIITDFGLTQIIAATFMLEPRFPGAYLDLYSAITMFDIVLTTVQYRRVKPF
jgi:hypothetical protein